MQWMVQEVQTEIDHIDDGASAISPCRSFEFEDAALLNDSALESI